MGEKKNYEIFVLDSDARYLVPAFNREEAESAFKKHDLGEISTITETNIVILSDDV